MIILSIFATWIAASCLVGPVLTWAFFYPERRDHFHQ